MVKRNMLVLLVVLLFASCAAMNAQDSGVKTKVTTGGASATDIISYQGPKARIAVGSFETKAGKAWGKIGDGMQEMIIDSLFKTNRFIVLESSSLQDIKGEFELGSGGWAASAPQKGTFETADILLTGAITAFEPDYQKRGGGGIVIPIPLKIGGGLKIQKKEAYIAASIRLVDVRTRRIIKTGTVEGYSSSSSLGILGGGLIGGIALGAGYESYKNTPMEKAVMIMLENAISEIVSSVPEDYYRYTAEGKSVESTAETKKKGLGIVGGQDRFTPGANTILSENFSRYNVGAVPEKWALTKAKVEIASYENSKWLRFLKDGQAKIEAKTDGDYSVEFMLFIPDRETDISIRYGDSPEMLIEKGSVKIDGNPAGNIESDRIQKFEFSRKREQVVFFLDGKRIYTSGVQDKYLGTLVISVKGIDVNQGREVLLTDIKISEYR
ncbi:MAG TPA: CsgG/HfaB family protein [bacterium]|nr:CsgG/HfaB family protein [bacterium]